MSQIVKNDNTKVSMSTNGSQGDTLYPIGTGVATLSWNETTDPPTVPGWYVVMKENESSPRCLRRYAKVTQHWKNVTAWMGPIPNHREFYFLKRNG